MANAINKYDYMLPVSATGTDSGPASAGGDHRKPVGPDGRGAYAHTDNTFGTLSAMNFWMCENSTGAAGAIADSEARYEHFVPGDARSGKMGIRMLFNSPGKKAEPLQNLETVRARVSGLGPSANYTVSATIAKHLTGSTVVFVDDNGDAWSATLNTGAAAHARIDGNAVGCTQIAQFQLPGGPDNRRKWLLGL